MIARKKIPCLCTSCGKEGQGDPILDMNGDVMAIGYPPYWKILRKGWDPLPSNLQEKEGERFPVCPDCVPPGTV